MSERLSDKSINWLLAGADFHLDKMQKRAALAELRAARAVVEAARQYESPPFIMTALIRHEGAEGQWRNSWKQLNSAIAAYDAAVSSTAKAEG